MDIKDGDIPRSRSAADTSLFFLVVVDSEDVAAPGVAIDELVVKRKAPGGRIALEFRLEELIFSPRTDPRNEIPEIQAFRESLSKFSRVVQG